MTFALPSRACRVAGCSELVEHPRSFCDPHWTRIPSALQLEIADAWADAQRQSGREAKEAWTRWGELVMRAGKIAGACP